MAFVLSLFASFAVSWAYQGPPEGYVSDVEAERSEKFYEVYLSPPPQESVVDYRGKVFNSQLTGEFRQRYVDRFGYIDQNGLSSAGRFTNFELNRGTQSEASLNLDRRSFGEYMVKRLGEWHFDNFMKSDPSVRPLYEAKERLSNVSVEVNKDTRAKMAYSVSDNSAEIVLENPYCDSKLRIEMDPRQVGPSPIQENRLFVGKALNKTNYIATHLTEKDGTAIIEWQRVLSWGAGTAFRISQPYKSQGYSPRETLLGAGLSQSF